VADDAQETLDLHEIYHVLCTLVNKRRKKQDKTQAFIDYCTKEKKDQEKKKKKKKRGEGCSRY
jgi:hypothetical protein